MKQIRLKDDDIYIIENCSHCPFETDDSTTCRLGCYLCYGDKFPETCPLEDYIDAKEDKE